MRFIISRFYFALKGKVKYDATRSLTCRHGTAFPPLPPDYRSIVPGIELNPSHATQCTACMPALVRANTPSYSFISSFLFRCVLCVRSPFIPIQRQVCPIRRKKLHFVVTVFAYTNISPKPYSVPIPPTPLETFDLALAGINSQQTPVIPPHSSFPPIPPTPPTPSSSCSGQSV